MPIKEIRIKGELKKVHYEEGSETAKNALHYLQENQDNAQDFFKEAHHDRGNGGNGITRFKLPPLHQYRLGSHHVTLGLNPDGTYRIHKQDKGILAS